MQTLNPSMQEVTRDSTSWKTFKKMQKCHDNAIEVQEVARLLRPGSFWSQTHDQNQRAGHDSCDSPSTLNRHLGQGERLQLTLDLCRLLISAVVHDKRLEYSLKSKVNFFIMKDFCLLIFRVSPLRSTSSLWNFFLSLISWWYRFSRSWLCWLILWTASQICNKML